MPLYKIGIVVDVDFDGYASASMLHKYLLKLNPNLDITVYFHEKKVHGLNDSEILYNVMEDDISLLFVPDAGSSDFTQHKLLKLRKTKVICLDHHDCERYSDDAVVINNQLSDKILNKAGSGTLVTWKFCKYCDKKLGVNFAPQLMEFVYFSLISDIMSMNTLENRFIANWYLNKSHIKHKLFKRLIDEFISSETFTNTDISFSVVPKLSAIIRGDDALAKRDLYNALVSEDDVLINEVINLSKKAHKNQQDLVKEYVELHKDSVDNSNNIIIEDASDLKSEYRGLVASKYVEAFGKTVLLYANNFKEKYTISLRSKLPAKSFINSNNIIYLGGHETACGGMFEGNDVLDDLKTFCKDAEVPAPIYDVIYQYEANKISYKMFDYFSKYDKLYGKDIEKPYFYIFNIRINTNEIDEIGNGTTIKFNYMNIDYIKFFCTKSERTNLWRIKQSKNVIVNVIGELTLNKFRGKTTPQVIIKNAEVIDV